MFDFDDNFVFPGDEVVSDNVCIIGPEETTASRTTPFRTLHIHDDGETSSARVPRREILAIASEEDLSPGDYYTGVPQQVVGISTKGSTLVLSGNKMQMEVVLFKNEPNVINVPGPLVLPDDTQLYYKDDAGASGSIQARGHNGVFDLDRDVLGHLEYPVSIFCAMDVVRL